MAKAMRNLITALIFALLLMNTANAQTPEYLEEAAPDEMVVVGEEPDFDDEEEEPVRDEFDVEIIDGRMTLNLPAISFYQFLKIISMHSDMRLMTTEEIGEKKLSIYLPDVSPQEALDAVCAVYDLFLIETPGTNVYMVRDVDVEFIRLEHIEVADLERLAPTLVEQGNVNIDEKNNIIAIKGSRPDINRVRSLVEKMDRPPRQVLIQATLAEISDDAERRLGIRWEPSAFFRGASKQTLFPLRRQWADVLDGVETTDAYSFGVVSFADFFVQLQAMERRGEAKILANPRIAAIDGREAEINILSNIVIATRVIREGAGLDLVTEEPIFADVGVSLKTTPRIHSDNSVTLIVEPSVSTAARSRFFDEAVDTFDRSARTTVLVEDGDTIAIGGLIRDDVAETERGVPYISRIPLLGRLFTHKERLGEQTDLVVFITPTVLGRESAQEDARLYRERFGR